MPPEGTSPDDDIPAGRQNEIRCRRSGAKDGEAFGGAGGLAFARPVLAHRAGLGRRQLHQVLAGEAGVAEAARLARVAAASCMPVEREVAERVAR